MPYKIRNNKLRQRVFQLLDTNTVTLQAFNSPDGLDCATILDEEVNCESIQAGLANGSLQVEKLSSPEPKKQSAKQPKPAELKE